VYIAGGDVMQGSKIT